MLWDWQQQLTIVRDEFDKIGSTRFVHTDDIFLKIFHWIKVIHRLRRIHKNYDALAAISPFCAADLHKYILSRCLTMLHHTYKHTLHSAEAPFPYHGSPNKGASTTTADVFKLGLDNTWLLHLSWRQFFFTKSCHNSNDLICQVWTL